MDTNYNPEAPSSEESILKLAEFINSVNIAEQIDDDRLKKIGARVVDEYLIDEQSREDWMSQNKEALKLAQQVVEEKSYPWDGASNVKLPIIANACIKFAARAYGELIQGDKVVKAKTTGKDSKEKEDRANRVSVHMSYQLMEEMTEWEDDHDKLLHIIALSGHAFKKSYFCPLRQRNVSELITAKDFCVNKNVRDLESARRKTHIIDGYHHNEIVSNQRSGIFLDVSLLPDDYEGGADTDRSYCLLEQHRWLDLDGDGYEEPYIVTVHKESRKVLRITARYDEDSVELTPDKSKVIRILQDEYFTSYGFIPALDGSFYHIGFGIMLQALNDTANGIYNRLLDAGTISNLQSGFLSRAVKVAGGNKSFEPGEWKKTNASGEELRNGIFPLPVREPSPTLFSLLGYAVDMANDYSSVKDVLVGDVPGANVPATTVMALIEQGMKTYNAIYKRVYRSMRDEFRKLYRLNSIYLEEERYFRVVDRENVISKQDYDVNDCDVQPVADPNLSSDVQRLGRAQASMALIGMPGVNPKPIIENYLDAIHVYNKEEILPEQQGPDINQIMAQKDLELREREIIIKETELGIKGKQAEGRFNKDMASAAKDMADIETDKQRTALDAVSKIGESVEREIERDEARIQAVVTASGNNGSPRATIDGAGFTS